MQRRSFQSGVWGLSVVWSGFVWGGGHFLTLSVGGDEYFRLQLLVFLKGCIIKSTRSSWSSLFRSHQRYLALLLSATNTATDLDQAL